MLSGLFTKKPTNYLSVSGLLLLVLCARRDSNPYRWYRKPKFYPLNYGRKKRQKNKVFYSKYEPYNWCQKPKFYGIGHPTIELRAHISGCKYTLLY